VRVDEHEAENDDVDEEYEEDEDADLVNGPYGQTQADPEEEDVEDTFQKLARALERHEQGRAIDISLREKQLLGQKAYVTQSRLD
jgi:exonuclease V gamma subunit